MPDAQTSTRTILVAGGGIAGLSAAVEAAEVGLRVVLVERQPYLGGRVARMNKYFPKLCPPQCGLEINFRRIRNNPLIRVMTMSEVEKIQGESNDFTVSIRVNPRHVNEKCTACGKCSQAARTEIPNPFDYGLSTLKAAYLPHEFAYPMRYVVAPEIIGTPEAKEIEAACKYGAVDLDMMPQTLEVKVGAIIWATGWTPYDISAIPYYGAGKHRNVISNVVMERLASANGPTGGGILRPSDAKPVKKIAFVQCAGSRDELHLAYCSGVCCLASLKQATYMLEQDPEAVVSIFYIDIRAPGRNEAFFNKVRQDDRVTLVKGKAGQIDEDPETGMVSVLAEDQETGKILREEFDLVVLAAGMVPSTASEKIPAEAAYDQAGFLLTGSAPGIFGAGCVRSPADVSSSVQDATAAVLRAIQACRR
ncbi:MAG TPA: CoB--CoM heterodisulfide reductase iron-sulfur subunit A family protein [Syntrophobacteraceae bacterium]|nr:CoB--CoM heterodisulfide reductase iron-sulfur subunit A family protein [Syntrophobacteraceae bacterium]